MVAGGADTQLGLIGAGIRSGEYTVVGGTFWQNTVLLPEPLIDPEARLRTLCHARAGEWMLEGIGFYCGLAMRWFRDAFCEAETAEAQRRGTDPYVVMEEAAARVPAGAHGVIAILSNLMNARRWVHASPSFLQFDLGGGPGMGRGACVRAIEEAAAYVARGHRDIISELTGTSFGELVFTGGAAKGQLWPQIMADVLGVPVHVPAVTESSALGRGHLRGRRRWRLPGPVRARAQPAPPGGHLRAAARGRRHATTTSTRPGAASTAACSTCPRKGCSTRCGGPPAPSGPRCAPPDAHAPVTANRHLAGRGTSMADTDDPTGGARFQPSVPARAEVFGLKGSGSLDWGMQSRLARIFRPATWRTVMLAIDHGYFQGPTTGLERVDLSIVPLLPHADALMTTRGMVRSTVPAASRTPIVLRASGGPSILKELSDEQIAVSMADAARINAAAVAVQVFIGGPVRDPVGRAT